MYLKATRDVFADNEILCEGRAFLGLEVLGQHDHRTRVDPVEGRRSTTIWKRGVGGGVGWGGYRLPSGCTIQCRLE